MRPSLVISAVAVALALAPFGCGESGPATSSEEQDPRFAAVTDRGGKAKPKIDPPDRKPPKKVLVRDIEVGSGPVARQGDMAFVHYVGINYETGEEQYRRWPPLPPLSVRLGFSGEGEGWEEGIEGMRAGGRREIIVPSRLLYDTGTIDYVVDLVRVKPEPQKTFRADRPPPGSAKQEGAFAAVSVEEGNEKPLFEPSDRPAPKALLTRDLVIGTGPAARRGDEVGLYYAGAVYETGKVKYYGWPPSEPVTFQLGFSAFGRAWERGIEGMKVGGRRQMLLPSRFLNGSEPLDYVIEMVSLKPASPKP